MNYHYIIIYNFYRNNYMLIKIWKSFSYTILVVVCLFIIIFSFIIFQIPIPYISNSIIKAIENKKPFLKNKISVDYLAIGWNYSINRPILFVKNFAYVEKENNIKIKNLSIYTNPSKIIKKEAIENIKIFIDGSNISLDLINEKDNIVDVITELINDCNCSDSNIATDTIKYQHVNFDILFKNISFLINKNKKQIADLKLDSVILKYHDEQIFSKVNASIKCYSKICSTINAELNKDKLGNNNINGTLFFNDLKSFKIILSEVYPKLDLKLLQFTTKSEANISFKANFDFQEGLKNITSNIKLYQTFFKAPNDTDFDISNLETNIVYKKENNNLNFMNLKINFVDNYHYVDKKNGFKLPVKSLTTDIKFSTQSGILDISNIKIKIKDDKYLNGSLIVDNVFSKKINYSIKANFLNFTTNDLALYWPKNILINFYSWMNQHLRFDNYIKDNILKLSFIQNIDKNDIKLNDVHGKVKINDAQLTYLPKSSLLNAESVDVVYNAKKVDIFYKNLKIDGYPSIFSSKGLVSIYNENQNFPNKPYHARLKLDLNLKGNAEETLNYLSSDPLNILNKERISPNWFEGSAEGTLLYDVSLEKNTTKILNVDLKLTDVMYKKDLNEYPIQNGILDLTIRDDQLHTFGVAKFDGSDLNLDIKINWKEPEKLIAQYTINTKQVNIDSIKKLEILPNIIWKYVDVNGKVDTDMEIYVSGDDARISFNSDIKNSAIDIKAFNYTKDKNSKFSVSGNIFLNNFKTFLIKDINIIANNFNTSFDVRTSTDLVNIDIKRLTFKDGELKGNLNIDNEDIDINLSGSKIDITNLLIILKDELKKSQITEENPSKKDIIDRENFTYDDINIDNEFLSEANTNRNVNVDLKFDIITSNKKLARNVRFILNIAGLEIEKIEMRAIFQKGLSSYTLYNKKTHLLEATIFNLGHALSFFDIYSGLKEGTLKAKVNMFYKKDEDTNKTFLHTDGNFIVYDFIIGVQFASGNVDFVGKNSFFVFKNIDLVGNFLAARYKGYLNSSYLNLDGTLLPAYSANSLIKNVPIIRDILRGLFTQDIKNATGKEFFQVNSNIMGYFGDLKYSFSRKPNEEIKSSKEKIKELVDKVE